MLPRELRASELEESIGNGLIDLNTADVQAVHSASTDHILARAMVSGRTGSARLSEHECGAGDSPKPGNYVGQKWASRW